MSVWVKFPEKRSVKIRVEGHSDIDDLVKEALKEERVDACRGSVTVKFDGKEVDSGEQLSAFQTSSKKPLFLRYQLLVKVMLDVMLSTSIGIIFSY